MSEIRTYTAAELTNPSIQGPPGWRRPGGLPSILAHIGEAGSWTPALSVSIFRDDPEQPGQIQTLTAIRGASTTHEGVVSTLTSTFPDETLPLLAKKREPFVIGQYPTVSLGDEGPNPAESVTIAKYWPQIEGVPDTRSLLPFYCHDVMARKLGRPDLISMRSDDELGTVSLARMALGVSYVGENKKDEPLYELLLMVGLAFMVHPHQAHMFDNDVHDRMSVVIEPKRRYSKLGWTAVQPFSEAVRTKNVIELAPYVSEQEAVMVCAHGQCLAMTSELIHDDPEMLKRHLGRSALDPLDYTGYDVGDPYGRRRRR